MHNVLLVDIKEDNSTKTNESYQVEGNSSLWSLLDSTGKSLPHGCLAGSCGACKILIIEGADQLKDPGPVEKDTIDHLAKRLLDKNGDDFLDGKSLRLSCRAKFKENSGDISISLI